VRAPTGRADHTATADSVRASDRTATIATANSLKASAATEWTATANSLKSSAATEWTATASSLKSSAATEWTATANSLKAPTRSTTHDDASTAASETSEARSEACVVERVAPFIPTRIGWSISLNGWE